MKSRKKDRHACGVALNLNQRLRKKGLRPMLTRALILTALAVVVSTPYLRGSLSKKAMAEEAPAQPAPEDELNYALTITSDYTLTRDIGPCDDGGIFVGADNITLDGNGHKIIGSRATESIGIYLEGRKGVTIKNCDVSNFITGVVLRNSENITLVDNSIHDNDDVDPRNPYGDGMEIFSSNNNVFVNNTIANCGAQGICFYTSLHNIVMNNTFKDNGSDSVWIQGGSHNTLINNTATNKVSGPKSAGFRISRGGEHNVLLDNSATGTLYGFLISGGDTKHNIVKGGFFNTVCAIRGESHHNSIIDIKLVRSGGVGLRFETVTTKQPVRIPHDNIILGGVIKGCEQGMVIESSWGNQIIGLKFVDCDVPIVADSKHRIADNTLINTTLDMGKVQLDEKSILNVLP